MRDPSPRTDRSAIDVKCKGEHHQNEGFSSIDWLTEHEHSNSKQTDYKTAEQSSRHCLIPDDESDDTEVLKLLPATNTLLFDSNLQTAWIPPSNPWIPNNMLVQLYNKSLNQFLYSVAACYSHSFISSNLKVARVFAQNCMKHFLFWIYCSIKYTTLSILQKSNKNTF